MADAIIEFVNLMYNRKTAKRVLGQLISRLADRIGEFKEKQKRRKVK